MSGPFIPPWMKRYEAEEGKEQFLRDVAERQAQENELLENKAPFSAYDPTLPPHPIFNAPPVAEIPGWKLSMLRDLRQVGCTEKQFEQALALVKAGAFRTRKQLGEHFKKDKGWAGGLVRVAVKWAYVSEDEIKRLLPGRKRTNNQTNT